MLIPRIFERKMLGGFKKKILEIFTLKKDGEDGSTGGEKLSSGNSPCWLNRPVCVCHFSSSFITLKSR